MTRIAIATALSLLLSSAVSAQTYKISPPNGWTKDDALASRVNQASLDGPELDGLAKKIETVAWLSPRTGALYVQSIFASEPSSDLTVAARAEIERLRPRAETSAGDASSVDILDWQQVGEDSVADITFHFRNVADETETLVRQLVFADKDKHLRVVRGECVLSTSAPKAQALACRRALESLELEGSAQDRLPIPGLDSNAQPEPVDIANELDAGSPAQSTSAVLYAGPPSRGSGRHYGFFFAGALVLMFGFFLGSRGRGSTATPSTQNEGKRDE